MDKRKMVWRQYGTVFFTIKRIFRTFYSVFYEKVRKQKED